MPMKLSCPSCSKTLTAPDTAGGKRAKCPACSQVMIIPAAAQPAEHFAAPLPSSKPSAPEPPDAGYGLMDELDGAIAAASGTATRAVGSASLGAGAMAGSGDDRRPCPACGEMIVADAAKCRFCGEVFDARLKIAAAKKNNSGNGAFRHEKRGIEKGVLGGAAMIAIAVVWFVGGWMCGVIFYYPPILFIIGVYAVVKGLATGNFAGGKKTRDYY